MRATGQARNLTGPLDPEEAPVVVARAILGEWLGGSGGGWQDSGGVFPGVKMIQGVAGRRGRPRVRASAGAGSCPTHEILDGRRRPDGSTRVPPGPGREPGPGPRRDGPERRADPEHGHGEVPAPEPGRVGRPAARRCEIFEGIVAAVRAADVRALGGLTTAELGRAAQGDHPLGQQPFTEAIIARGEGGAGRGLLGLPDARRDVGRRDGLLRRPAPQGRVPATRSARS